MSGTPSVTASVAASEKLRREVVEMTIDARQRLKDCKSIENGAVSGGWRGMHARMAGGTRLNAKKRIKEET